MARSFSRREVLALGAAGALVACAPGGSPDQSTGSDATITTMLPSGPRPGPSALDLPPYELSADFPEGILSDDPDDSSVILWTRPSPDLVASGADLVAELATDTSFARPIATVSQRPDPAREGACHFHVEGLDQGTAYFFRFRIGEAVSPIGLTRTTPGPDQDVDELRLAVFSCQRWTHGYYTAHADLADQAPDLVLCLGDYVYETGFADGVSVAGRDDPIQDARTLEEFRRKYELYRSDINLQMVHRVAPLEAIPDSEVLNAGTYINLAQWDGYQAERIGDGSPQTSTLLEAFGLANRAYARYVDGDRHGYGLVTLRHDGAEVEYRSPRTIVEPTSPVDVVARFTMDPERPGLRLTEAVRWDPATGLPESVEL